MIIDGCCYNYACRAKRTDIKRARLKNANKSTRRLYDAGRVPEIIKKKMKSGRKNGTNLSRTAPKAPRRPNENPTQTLLERYGITARNGLPSTLAAPLSI